MDAQVSTDLVETQPINVVQKKLIDQLTMRIGRQFHQWDKDDKTINK